MVAGLDDTLVQSRDQRERLDRLFADGAASRERIGNQESSLPCWRSERPQLSHVSLKFEIPRTNPRGVFSRVSGLRRDKRHSGHFDRVAPVVMSKNPRFHAGQGCRRDQIIAIRAECRFQLVQAVGRVTGGRVRHMVRDDKGWPIMRLSQLAGQPYPRELMLGQSILWKEGKGAAAPNEAMIVKLAFGYRHGLLAGAGDGVVCP